jgi:ribosome maturation factor RimP
MRDERLFQLGSGTVEGMGYTLVAVEDGNEHGRRVIRFIVDHPRGISLGDCEALSREIGYVLEADPGLGERFVLEVSSPGLDRELRTEREYAHFAGREARFVLRSPVDGQSVVFGVIVSAGPEGVRVRLRDAAGEALLPYGSISRARLAG